MVPSRSLTVLVAVALGVIAIGAAYLGVHSASQNAYKGARLASAYVLKGVVPRDESVSAAYAQGLIEATRVPLRYVPAGAVTDLSAIRDRVAGSDLPAGEVVVRAMFVSPEVGASVAAETVPQGDVAISVSVDQVHGVAGLIEPGDQVDILVDIEGARESSLYQSVPVMAVGSTLVPPPGTRAAAAPANAPAHARDVITLAVPPAAASRIAQADSGGGGVTGGVYLALVPPGTAPTSTPAITAANLVSGGPAAAPGTALASKPVSAAPTGAGAGPHPTDQNQKTP